MANKKQKTDILTTDTMTQLLFSFFIAPQKN